MSRKVNHFGCLSLMTIIAQWVALSTPICHATTTGRCVTFSLQNINILNKIGFTLFICPTFLHNLFGSDVLCLHAYVWSPTQLFCHPADFSPAVCTAHPITAPFFQKYHLATWTIQCFSSYNQTLSLKPNGINNRLAIQWMDNERLHKQIAS